MTLDELLQQNKAWLEQALTRRFFDKVDENTIKFPEEQRERRESELEARIDMLRRRQAEAVAAYDRAIARETEELESVTRETSPLSAADMRTDAKRQGKTSRTREGKAGRKK
jgi:hypothetical protein